MYRQVTPLECPECNALWLFWPAEQSGFGHDSLNLRSPHSCDYCEQANYYNLKMFGLHAHLSPADESEGPRCSLPQELGKSHWSCSRKQGHNGSCALSPKGFLHSLYWKIRLLWKRIT